MCVTWAHVGVFTLLVCVPGCLQGPEKEACLAELTARISGICGKRGVMIKPFFDVSRLCVRGVDGLSSTLVGTRVIGRR
jgi:hypothetical protein